MKKETLYQVVVVSFETTDVIKRLGPMSKAKAEKVDDSMQHNLDHARFYTRIVDVKS